MGHMTVVMTLRYSHLSPKHQLDEVQRLVSSNGDRNRDKTDANTDTGEPDKIAAQGAGAELV